MRRRLVPFLLLLLAGCYEHEITPVAPWDRPENIPTPINFEVVPEPAGGAAVLARWNAPFDVWVDPVGMFYVSDTGNSRTLQLDAQGTVREIVNEFDTDPASAPNTLAATRDEVWVVDPDRGRLTIYRINTATEELP